MFLFCSVDGASVVLNAGILLMLVKSKSCRLRSSNRFFTSIVAFQLVTALTAIVFAVRFQTNKAEEVRKDTVIVQITFTLLGLGLSHFMLTIDRLVSLNMQSQHSLVIGNKQSWFMVGLSWVIPTLVAVVSALIVTTGEPSSQVSYALATLTAASGLASSFGLLGLNAFLLNKLNTASSPAYTTTRRHRNVTVFNEGKQRVFTSRICIAMAFSNVLLMSPLILFAFGKLLRTRGLLDMWYMQLASTLMLCSGVVDACLYVYMNKPMRKCLQEKIRRLCGKDKAERDEEMLAMYTKSPSKGSSSDSKEYLDAKNKELMLAQDFLKKDIEIMLL